MCICILIYLCFYVLENLIYLSTCLPKRLATYLLMYLPTYLPTPGRLPACLPTYLHTYLPTSLQLADWLAG